MGDGRSAQRRVRLPHLFERRPQPLAASATAADVGWHLGATLYVPANREDLVRDVQRLGDQGVMSAIFCLEDAVPDDELERATGQVHLLLEDEGHQLVPLRFLRVRDPGHLATVCRRLGSSVDGLTGFVFAKFRAADASAWFEALDAAGAHLLAMPVLEGPEILWHETRRDELERLAVAFEGRADQVAAIRLGATDLAGLLGLRPSRSCGAATIGAVAECLTSVVNRFNRDGCPPVTGPVVETYRSADGERVLLEACRRDREEGFVGKSAIHPEQVRVIEAAQVVLHQDHLDAEAILRGSGAFASSGGDRMNEARPHLGWARRTMRRAQAFGVLRAGVDVEDLLTS